MEPAGILLLIGFPVGPLLLGLYAWRRTRIGSATSTHAVTPAPLWPGLINASLAIALAFNLVYFVQEFFLAWPKSLLSGVQAVVYHNNHGWSGDHPSILLYQGAGALAIIVLGTLLMAIGGAFQRQLKGFHPILWWGACMAFGLGLIQVTIAAMHPDNDVGQAFDYLALAPLSRNLLALVATLAVMGFGVFFSRPLLAMAPPGAIATAGARVRYVFKFALLPLLLGTLLSWANRGPSMGHLTLPLFSGLFVLPWTLAWAALADVPEAATDRLHRAVDQPLLVVSVLVLVLFWWVLAPGLAV